jgi:hypothetical protein
MNLEQKIKELETALAELRKLAKDKPASLIDKQTWAVKLSRIRKRIADIHANLGYSP